MFFADRAHAGFRPTGWEKAYLILFTLFVVGVICLNIGLAL